MPLILLFIGLPLLELSLLIEVSERIGWMPTLAVAVVTGIAGASLARSQGLALWVRLQAELAAGRAPTETMLEGVLVLMAGLVLLTPGFLTDITGLLCLMPWTRRPLLVWLRRRLKAGQAAGRVKVHLGGMAAGPGNSRAANAGPDIKDAEVIDDGARTTRE